MALHKLCRHVIGLVWKGTSPLKTLSASVSHQSGSAAYEEYHEHQYLPTTSLQQVVLACGSSLIAITNPWRGDMVAVCGESTGLLALRRMRGLMQADPVGRQILEEKPRINTSTVDMEHLKSLPEGSLGRTYVDFCEAQGISPDARHPVRFIEDVELAYVMQRYRETHDLVHALLGMRTDMLGEVCVKVVEALQTGLPMCVAGALLGPVRLYPKQRRKFINSHLWWALGTGRRAKPLLNVYYEKRWEEDVTELRHELCIPELIRNS